MPCWAPWLNSSLSSLPLMPCSARPGRGEQPAALGGAPGLAVIARQPVGIVRQLGQHGLDDGGPVQLHRQVLPQLDALIVLVADHPFVGGIRRGPDPGAMTHPGRQQTPPLGFGCRRG